MEHLIDYPEAFKEVQNYLVNSPTNVKLERGGYLIEAKEEKFFIPMKSFPKEKASEIASWIGVLKDRTNENSLIYGKDPTENIVGCECKDGVTELFIEKDGVVSTKFLPQRQYIISATKYTKDFIPLEGGLFYKFIKFYSDSNEFFKDKKMYYGRDVYMINDPKESAMVLNGFTYYKGMKVNDVSVLSFDIETTGLEQNEDSKVLLISNTYRSQGQIIKRLFSLDDFTDEKEMLEMWCGWVRARNPSVILGHNIFGYDLPYIDFCAKQVGAEINLGRDESKLKFNKYTSKFRKDGSQDYNYNKAYIYGREIVDTMFVAYHFDFSRKYESYGLKSIIKQEGLEKPGRQFYDASKIAIDWPDPEKRKRIKQYGADDADDALALYDLMIPAYFYWTQHIPKTFQTINCSATGAQLNSFLVRSYLQQGHSIPSASDVVKLKGAISDGFPGIYKNVFKVDVASLYPSIILQYSIEDSRKDPKGHFLKMVRYFTEQRLEDKKKAKETGDRYYQELEQSRKIAINSAYGLLSTPGIQFNSPQSAALVTEYGRTILKKAILWATGTEYIEKDEMVVVTEENEVDNNEEV